jgi:signal-transduction protein with cAMP-binding, CBS, and nucleotidyltransferase domain
MSKNIISVLPETSIVEATRIMSKRDISSILVKTGDDYIGIFTDRDVMKKVVASGLDPNNTVVREIMSSPLITINEEASIEEAADKMRDSKIRRLVVINEGYVAGIISETDIVRIEPELHLLIREHSKLQLHPSRNIEGRKGFAGFCEECNNYSSLENFNGRWLCQECR